MHRPHKDWAENDPEDWYLALAAAVSEVLKTSRVSAVEVKALCLVGQRDVAVLVDDQGEVVTPCIHWTDRRDPGETTELYDRLGRTDLIDRSGTLPIPGLVLPNLAWTKAHLPDVWARVRVALQPKDYLALRLTGDIGTDPTGPTRSVLNDWRSQDWSSQTCDEAGIPREILPDVKYQPWEPRGELGTAAYDLGLLPGTVLVAGGGDDPAAALGSGVINARRRQHRHRLIDELAHRCRRTEVRPVRCDRTDATPDTRPLPSRNGGHRNGHHTALVPNRVRRRKTPTSSSSPKRPTSTPEVTGCCASRTSKAPLCQHKTTPPAPCTTESPVTIAGRISPGPRSRESPSSTLPCSTS